MRRLLHSSALCCGVLLALSAQAQSGYYQYPSPDNHHVSSHNKQIIHRQKTTKPRPAATIDHSSKAPSPGDQARNVFLPQHPIVTPAAPIALEPSDNKKKITTDVQENTAPTALHETAIVEQKPTPVLSTQPAIETQPPNTMVQHAAIPAPPVHNTLPPPETMQLIDTAGMADDALMAMIPEADDIFEIAPTESAPLTQLTHSVAPAPTIPIESTKIDTQPSQKVDAYHTFETTGISPSISSDMSNTVPSDQAEQTPSHEKEIIDSPITYAGTNADITLTAGNTVVPTPALSELPEIVVPTSVSPTHISEDTYRILSMIPSNIDRPSAFSKRRVSIKRENPEAGLSNIDEDVARHEGLGLSIAVKRRRYDGAYDLQRAYDALVAGQTQEAINIYHEVIDNLPRNTDALFGLATTYQRIGHLDEARYYYAKLFAIDEGHREGINNFLALVAEESPEEALLYLEELEQRNPDFSAVPAQIALVRSHIGDIEGAKTAMIRAMRLAPNNLVYRYNLAIMLDNAGNIPEARALYIQLIEAAQKGQKIPASIKDLQKRLTFISSNG